MPIQLKCEICDKTFDRKYNLLRHSRVHQQKVINLVCSECSKTFANAANLKTHFDDVHNGKKMASPKSALVTNKGNKYFCWNILIIFILKPFPKMLRNCSVGNGWCWHANGIELWLLYAQRIATIEHRKVEGQFICSIQAGTAIKATEIGLTKRRLLMKKCKINQILRTRK